MIFRLMRFIMGWIVYVICRILIGAKREILINMIGYGETAIPLHLEKMKMPIDSFP